MADRQATPPPFLTEFIEGRHGWELTQRHDGAWLAERLLKMPPGLGQFILRLVPGLQHPTSDRDWSVTFVNEDGVKGRLDGAFDEVVTELQQFERTLQLLAELTQCTRREQAAELVESVRGRQLEFLRQAAGVPRGPAPRMRQQIVHRTCGIRLDLQALAKGDW